jgi:hypothetical protein
MLLGDTWVYVCAELGASMGSRPRIENLCRDEWVSARTLPGAVLTRTHIQKYARTLLLRRVFPEVMRAAPLLKNWLTCLADLGVKMHTNTRWEVSSPRRMHIHDIHIHAMISARCTAPDSQAVFNLNRASRIRPGRAYACQE